MGGENWQEKIRRLPREELLPDSHIPLSADEKSDPSSSVRGQPGAGGGGFAQGSGIAQRSHAHPTPVNRIGFQTHGDDEI